MNRNDLIKKINNSSPLEKRLILELIEDILYDYSDLVERCETYKVSDFLKEFKLDLYESNK